MAVNPVKVQPTRLNALLLNYIPLKMTKQTYLFVDSIAEAIIQAPKINPKYIQIISSL